MHACTCQHALHSHDLIQQNVNTVCKTDAGTFQHRAIIIKNQLETTKGCVEDG